MDKQMKGEEKSPVLKEMSDACMDECSSVGKEKPPAAEWPDTTAGQGVGGRCRMDGFGFEDDDLPLDKKFMVLQKMGELPIDQLELLIIELFGRHKLQQVRRLVWEVSTDPFRALTTRADEVERLFAERRVRRTDLVARKEERRKLYGPVEDETAPNRLHMAVGIARSTDRSGTARPRQQEGMLIGDIFVWSVDAEELARVLTMLYKGRDRMNRPLFHFKRSWAMVYGMLNNRGLLKTGRAMTAHFACWVNTFVIMPGRPETEYLKAKHMTDVPPYLKAGTWEELRKARVTDKPYGEIYKALGAVLDEMDHKG